MAITALISTSTTIAICTQIQNGFTTLEASGSSRGYVRRLGVAGAAWQGRRPAGIPLGFQVVEDAARR
jgi:hypothetical protein